MMKMTMVSGLPRFLASLSQPQQRDLARADRTLYLGLLALETYSPYAYLVDMNYNRDLQALAVRVMPSGTDWDYLQLRDLQAPTMRAVDSFFRLRERQSQDQAV